ncbi:MAG: DMT family transporter [Alphaproteobacteria bacterium]|nr:DMT family transporter [Alphaproteobacteria bacterium]
MRWRSARFGVALTAIAWIVAANLATSFMHVMVRSATESGLHPFEVAFFRNLFGFAVMIPFIVRIGPAVFRTGRIDLQIARATLQMVSMWTFFSALGLAPLTVVVSTTFAGPLFATIGAILILNERWSRVRAVGLIVGFVGALIIIRPGLSGLSLGALLALGSAAVWSMTLLVIKTLTRTDSSSTIITHAVMFMTPISLVPALFVWQWPSLAQYALVFGVAVAAQASQYALTQALRGADTTQLMPFEFTRLIWAAFLGFLIFAEIPDLWAVAGGALILSGTLYIAYREAGRAKEPAPPR